MSLDVPLTREQASALQASLNVALSSGAGCGKTFVLTERFLKTLEGPNGIKLSHLVALTFTEKAAAELRGRIRGKCRERIERETEETALLAWQQTLRGLEAARIGTFHGFCGDLLRQYPIEAGVAPEFEILEESIAPTLRDQALARCLRQWLTEKNPDLIELAVEHGLETVRQALRAIIQGRSLGDLQQWIGKSPEELLEIWKAHWQQDGLPGVLEMVLQQSQECLNLLKEHKCTHETGRQRWAFLVEHLPRVAETADPVALLLEIRENARVQGGGTKNHWPSPEIFEQVRDALKALRDRVIARALQALQWDEAASLAAADQGIRFARLAAKALEDYAQAKSRAEVLDFDDLLNHVFILLRSGNESTRDKISSSIHALLVDEFQDTDRIQSEILQLLTRPGPEQTSERLFLVGDTKQSIYRFRGAEPDIFDKFRAGFQAEGRLALSKNFRSVPGVLHFVNALFAEALYGNDPSAALWPKPGLFESEDPVVEFLWAEEPVAEPEPAVEKKNAEDRRKEEARRIAQLLAQRLKGDWQVGGVKDHEPRRPAHAGDIVLLFRSLNDAPPYEQALAEAGLDYQVVGGSAFFAQQEVLDLVNLLSVIEDPLDPLALAASLRGPFFGLSDDALYWLATSWQDGHPCDLDENLRHCESIQELDPIDRRRALQARNRLDAWRARKDAEPIATLLDRVLEESGFEASLMGEWLGARKRANVRKLVRLARRYDRHGLALADFVARLRADLRETPKEDQAATGKQGDKAVRLMTIHQAKGLEFPIVVLPDLNRKPPQSSGHLVIHSTLGPIVRPAQDGPEEAADSGTSLGERLYSLLEKEADRQEALRLFYVATTRAMNHLILSSGIVPQENPSLLNPALELLSQRFDLTNGQCRCLSALPADWPAPRVGVILTLPEAKAAAGPILRPPQGHSIDRQRLANVIANSRPIEAEPLRPVSQPGLFDLTPDRTLSPGLARLDRLIHAVLADPKGLDLNSLEEVSRLAARRVVPALPGRIVQQARERLAPWLAGPQAQSIARSRKILRAKPWARCWPPEGGEQSQVFRGAIDFAYLDRRGAWQVLALSLAEAPDGNEDLRLFLSALASKEFGAVPISRCWRVRLGPEGRFDLFESESFETDAEIAAAVNAVQARTTNARRSEEVRPPFSRTRD